MVMMLAARILNETPAVTIEHPLPKDSVQISPSPWMQTLDLVTLVGNFWNPLHAMPGDADLVFVTIGIDWGQGQNYGMQTFTAYSELHCEGQVSVMKRGTAMEPDQAQKDGVEEYGHCYRLAEFAGSLAEGKCTWQSVKGT